MPSNQNKQCTQKVQLEILQKRLEAKSKDNGIRIFKCEILPGGVVQMVYTIPEESAVRPEELRQSQRAKEKLERRIEALKTKVDSYQPHPPTPSPPTPSTTHNQQSTPSPPIQTNISPKRPTRRLDTNHFTHSLIQKALQSAGNSHPRTILK